MTVETTQEPADIFAMSSEEFDSYQSSISTSSDESASADLSTDSDSFRDREEGGELNNELDKVDESGTEDDEYIEVGGLDDEIEEDTEFNDEESGEATSDTDEQELEATEDDEVTESTDDVDFDADEAFTKIFAEPIKANGKEYKVESKEDAIKLIQMGMGFYKNMEALRPKRNLIAMLDNNGIDEDKLNFAIDLLNKNPQAINKLIADQDLSEIIDDKNAEYTPNNHKVDERQLNVQEALAEIEDTPTYARTVNILGKEWDDTSRKIVQENTHLIATINSHVENGMFDSIIAEVDKRMMLGSIPHGTPMLHAYKMVGDEMYATAGSQTAPNPGQQTVSPQANAKPPIRKPSEQVRQNKLAASKPRSTPVQRQPKKVEDVFAMSDEEFNKKYGFK